MEKPSIEGFFRPHSVAVLGASGTPGKAGYNVTFNLRNARVKGGVHPVNPNRDEILGFRAVGSLDELSSSARPLDLVVVCLPPEMVGDALDACIQADAKRIVLESGQFAETPRKAREVQDDLKQKLAAMDSPPRVMGPNSIGVVDLETWVNTSLIPFERLPDPQLPGVALVGQTGLIASGYLQRIFAERTFPVSKVCCLGNKFDVDEVDLLEFLADDPSTSVVALYLEDVRRGRRFLEAARKCSSAKPVVVLKSARSSAGARAASSHTGSLAGDDRLFDAALSSAGAVRVADFEELFRQAQFFQRAGVPRGNRVAVVSITGAGCVLSADATSGTSLRLAPFEGSEREKLAEIFPQWFEFDNPLDLWAAIERVGPEEAYRRAIDASFARHDAVVVVNLAMPESVMDWGHLASAKAENPRKPLVLVLLGGQSEMVHDWKRRCASLGVPVVKSPDHAISCLMKAWKHAEWLRRDAGFRL
ncbi:MAG: hypothetical protein Kow0069_36510 [Promethearchaeota archaeon]